jgi:predicted metal-binding membrane protein
LLEQIDALGRDGVIASAAIVALLIVAWTYLIWLFWSVPGIPGAQMAQTEFPFVFAMWAVMMVGMMTPSFTPTVLAYLQLGRHPVIRNQPLAPAGWLLAGYLLVWLIFAIIASAAQTALLEAHLITPTGSSSDYFSAIVLISAGLYQLSPFKDACLSHCRVPLHFIQSNGGFSTGSVASLRLGLKNGLYCVGCCWALTMILFAVGVMQLGWVALLSVFILLEKVDPLEAGVTRRVSAFFLFGAGIVFLIRSVI